VDYYVVLGIAEDSSDEAIRSAFRALARRYHPDVGAGSSLVEFQRAREAYETLVHPERRRRYDRQLRAPRVRRFDAEELVVSKPFVEPLFSSSRGASSVPTAWPNGRSSFFDAIVEELFGRLDDEWPPPSWWPADRRRYCP
jgi:curved DNA-binding protein CbpA